MPTKPPSIIDQKKLNELKDKFEKTYGKLNTEEGRKKFANSVEKMSVHEFNKIKEFNNDSPNIQKFLNEFEIYFKKDKEGNVVRFKKPKELQDEFNKAYKTILKRHKDYEARTLTGQKQENNEKNKLDNTAMVIEKKDLDRREYQEPKRVTVSKSTEVSNMTTPEVASKASEFSVWPLVGLIIIFFVMVGIFWKWIKK